MTGGRSEDTRDQETVAAHTVMAKSALAVENARILELATAHEELAPMTVKVPDATSEFVYHAQMDYGGLLYAVVEVTFYDWNDRNKRVGHFFGHSGGLVLGVGVTWGTAWLNYSIESIRNWDARFLANMYPGATNVNWWGMSGEAIGAFVGGGLGIGTGIVGGQGKFNE